MAKIASDHELRVALDGLTRAQQRVLGGRFVQSVLDLSEDPRVHRAVLAALDPEAVEVDLDDAFRAAKAVSVRTYTDCGKDTDWLVQAAHFVAAAAAACLTPESQPGSDSPAWKAAMQARMARNCALIEHGDAGDHDEPQTQYRLTAELLS
jgi:hypothetical protein